MSLETAQKVIVPQKKNYVIYEEGLPIILYEEMHKYLVCTKSVDL
jgi:hypothetical protein